MWRRVGSVIEAVRGVGKSEEAGDGREGSEWRERGGVGSYLISRRGDTTLNFHISIFMSVYMFHDQPGQYPGQDFLGPYFFKGPYSPPTIWKTYQYYI